MGCEKRFYNFFEHESRRLALFSRVQTYFSNFCLKLQDYPPLQAKLTLELLKLRQSVRERTLDCLISLQTFVHNSHSRHSVTLIDEFDEYRRQE